MSSKRRVSMTVLLVLMCCARLQGDGRERFFREGAVRVLLFSGWNNHEWRVSTPILRSYLEQSGRFDVRVTEDPHGMTSATLAPYDLIVLDYQGPRWGRETEQAVSDFVRGGKGLVVFHGASYAFSGLDVLGENHVSKGLVEEAWPEYLELTGGVWSATNPKTAHGKRHSFTVKFVDQEHPVSSGLGQEFVATDELYHDLRMHPSVHVLATAYSDPATGGTGEDEPVLWTINYGKGRVFQTTLGHDAVATAENGFVTTFTRGCEWAATGKVSLPPQTAIRAADPAAPRALVVTGGHDFQTEFYRLFEGDWLKWDHATSNREAFSRDIRDRYDVLVFYDMSRELDADGRKRLQEFAESGKGMVVLHHALANYPDWAWWREQLVGGQYLLEDREPHSSYLHDVDLFARPVGDHPVVRGISPLHLVDETYKGMWISPRVQVILETDEPSSDRALAWISPYSKSRVIAIQLGHDRLAYLNPGYHALVRRAILWAGGALK